MNPIDNSKTCPNKKLVAFVRLNNDFSILKTWREMFLSMEPQVFQKGEIIIGQGTGVNHLYYVLDGLVQSVHTDQDGNERLIEVIGMGTLLNLRPFILSDNIALGALTALEKTTVVSIHREKVMELISKDMRLARELLEEMSLITSAITRQLLFNTVSATTRVYQVLYCLTESKLFGGSTENQVFIDLSQSDLARISRTTRVTVTKTLSKLKQGGIVDTLYGGIFVKDFLKLKDLAEKDEM